ncbi:transcription factor AP-4-like [Cetorhinus maximus]
MAYYSGQKTLQEFRKAEKEVIGGLCSLSNIPLTPESQRDHDRRIRREIANSNERRRMQSINAGFQSLKVLLPHTDGEKLSKAAILQQTAEYIFTLEEDKTRLIQQNAQLKRLVQVRCLESQLQPDKLKEMLHPTQLQQEYDIVLERRGQLVEEQQRTINPAQLSIAHSPPAPTHHPTVIVPAPLPPSVLQVNVVTMAPSSVISTVSTSKQNLDTIVQAIQHIEATEQGVKEPERAEKQTTAFLNLDRVQDGVKEEREWHGLVTASPLIIKSSFSEAESESQEADRRDALTALRPKVEVEPIPSVLVPGTGIL